MDVFAVSEVTFPASTCQFCHTTFKRSIPSMVSVASDQVCCLETSISWILFLQKQCIQKNMINRIYLTDDSVYSSKP